MRWHRCWTIPHCTPSSVANRPLSKNCAPAMASRSLAGRPTGLEQRWLNWIVRRRDDGQTVGFVQATISEQTGDLTADVAWVVAVCQQRSGYAREAGQLMADWLRQRHVHLVVAHVHPQHHASNAVAAWIGLTLTDTQVDGEVRWQG